MNITDMTGERFMTEFIAALLRSGGMNERDIEAAYKEARQLLTGGLCLQGLIDGTLNAKWRNNQLLFDVNPDSATPLELGQNVNITINGHNHKAVVSGHHTLQNGKCYWNISFPAKK